MKKLILENKSFTYKQLLTLFLEHYPDGKIHNLIMDHCTITNIPKSVEYILLLRKSGKNQLLGLDMDSQCMVTYCHFNRRKSKYPSGTGVLLMP